MFASRPNSRGRKITQLISIICSSIPHLVPWPRSRGSGREGTFCNVTGDVAADPLPGPNSPVHRRKGARKLSVTPAARTISRRNTASLPALARCEGFRVDSRDGYVGVVDALRYSPSTRWDHPSELAVYAGRSSATLLIIPSSEVEGVCLAERRVLLRPSPKIAATERME
jgi:hypothetical protein